MDRHTETPNTIVHLPPRRRTTSGKAMSPQGLIQFIMDKHKDKDAAIDAVVDAAEHNASLQEFLVRSGARNEVGARIRSDNQKIFTGNPNANVNPSATSPLRMTETPLVNERHARRLNVRADSTLKLLGVMLPNGVMMVNAKREDIRNAIDHYEPQAKDMWHKANYYKSVYRDMPDGKAVGEVFDDAALTALFNSTRAE